MSSAVVTGVGVVSAFGVGARPFFAALSEGRHAVGPIRSFDASSLSTRVAGEVPVEKIDPAWLRSHFDFDARIDRWFDEGALRDRKISFALLAATEAWRSARCTRSDRGAWLSIALGLERAFLEDFAPIFADRIDWSRERTADLPAIRFRSRVDLAAELVKETLELQGNVVVNASACAAGALAIAHAASLIERGAASIVLCGAADSMVNPLGIGGMTRLGAPSPRNAPDACRPFDKRRDGLAIGEGAAMFVVESEARARGRGAKILARILGWGSTQDAHRPTAPRPDGSSARRAMERALVMAELQPIQIGHIDAHGTGTLLNDEAEAKAIRELFGSHTDQLPVSSIKGAVGHLMAASGAIELAACLLPFQRGLLPGTAHHTDRDPRCEIEVISERPIEREVSAVLSNSFGFGGQNASVILGSPS